MLDLVSLSEMKRHVGLSDAETTYDAVLGDLLAGVEALFNQACGRATCPFQAAQTGRVEWRDGSRGTLLWLDYPVSDVTEVLVGKDPANPITTLDPDDVDQVRWFAGDRRLERTDGSAWGTGFRVVRVTYDAQDDLPEQAKLAVKRVTAAAFQQRGSEDAVQESIAGQSRSLRDLAAGDPAWTDAVAQLRRKGPWG